jgi:hypothetical protein
MNMVKSWHQEAAMSKALQKQRGFHMTMITQRKMKAETKKALQRERWTKAYHVQCSQKRLDMSHTEHRKGKARVRREVWQQ